MQAQIKMNVSKPEMQTILRIVDRAMDQAKKAGITMDRISLEMDLCCVHANDGLKLEALLAADDFNFAHDVFGIARHLNRETGELEDFFCPRYSA
jgi:hypothetical protein